MNKYFFISCCFILIFNSCVAQTESNKSLIIIYKAYTRGSFVLITFKKKAITYQSTNRTKKVDLNEDQIRRIKKEVDKIDLSKMSSFKAPSSYRKSDRDFIATIKIVTSNKVFLSSEFDHQNPPKELVDLYTLLKKYSQ